MEIPVETCSIPVAGGELAGRRWGRGDRLVVASHGITANHLSWQAVAEALVARTDKVSLVAIDHRGRAHSASVPGPFGMAAHADDVASVIDWFGADTATVVGHSMGGFVATMCAERHPDRIERLVLVDGGVPFALDLPPDADVEAVVQSVIGPALDRLDQRWPDEDSYVDFFRAHPAFQPPNEWTATVEAYVRHDAVASPEGEVRSSVDKAAVLVDGGAAITDPESASAIDRITTPTVLLWAPRGILDQAPGLYTADQVAELCASHPHVDAELVADTNHYTIAVGAAGAHRIAAALT